RLLAKRLWPAPNRVEKCRGGAPRGERPDRKGRRDASLALASRRARKSTSGCLEGPKHPRVSRRSAPPRLPGNEKERGNEETEPTGGGAPLNKRPAELWASLGRRGILWASGISGANLFQRTRSGAPQEGNFHREGNAKGKPQWQSSPSTARFGMSRSNLTCRF